MNQRIIELQRKLSEVASQLGGPLPVEAMQVILQTISLLGEIDSKAKKVVNSCLHGNSQAAERFAYELSGKSG